MKISWGIKITILYSAFVILILSLVSMASSQNVDLVSKDYYEQELKYQDRIDKINQSNALQNPLTWEVKKDVLALKFPEQFIGQKINGSIYFFRPSDASLDKSIPINTELQLLNIETNQLKKGLYKIQINWEVNKVTYFNEGIIHIN